MGHVCRLAIVAAWALATAGCAREESMTFTATPSRKVVARLADVQRAEVFAIASGFDRPSTTPATQPAEAAERFGRYPILARGAVEDRAAAQELARLVGASVLEPPEGIAKGCLFVPHHGVRFFDAAGKSVDFTLCFTCGDARVSDFAEWFWLDKGTQVPLDAFFARHGVAAPDGRR